MKTFKLIGLLLAFFSVSIISCQKNAQTMSGDATDDLQTCTGTGGGGFTGNLGSGSATNNGSTGTMLPAEQNNIPAGLNFCNPKTVQLCTTQGNVGSVTVQKGFDSKIYVTYTLSANWYFSDIRLYTGSQNGIPMSGHQANLCTFPYKKIFTKPYSVQVYTFVLRDEPSTFTLAAYAEIVKIVNNKVRQTEEAWGDGCSGQRIYTGNSNGDDDDHGHHGEQYDRNGHDDDDNGDCKAANWATRFDYTSGACAIVSAAAEPDGLCSRVIPCYFGINPLYNSISAWPVPDVTVGGHTYTEAEGRAIADAPDSGGVIPDSKFAFMRVATLKLSNTGWELSPTLNTAVATIESYLNNCGKLSPVHMPTGNINARNAAVTIDTWIDGHICPDRR